VGFQIISSVVADNGVIGASGTTYDQYGHADGQVADQPGDSWTGNHYAISSWVSGITASPVHKLCPDFRSRAGSEPIHRRQVIMFLAACDTGAEDFRSLWNINNNTTGQADRH
jgi:hypothetical protein